MNITIVGAGYVGLVTGATCAYFGHNITFVDVDTSKLDAIRRGESPIYEPGLAELLQLGLDRIACTEDYAQAVLDADIVFITVGTPYLPDGSPNMTFVHAAAEQIGLNIGDRYTLIVNKSTVPVGSGNWVEAIVRDAFESRNGHRPTNGMFAVASNPEFLREGSALHDTFYADRIVIGSHDPRAIALLSELYQPIRNQDFVPPAFLPRPEGQGAVPLVTTDPASAELIKYAANAFLTVKISFINEMASLAESVGGDIAQISRGIGFDSRIGSRFLQAGIGWGGSCFGKDTSALISIAREYGKHVRIVEAAREVNSEQREKVIEKLLAELKIIKGTVIGILGLAFKPNTDDLRDAPALDIARRLIVRGAKILAHDPIAMDRARAENKLQGLCFKETANEVFEDADAVVLATEWQQYKSLPFGSLVRSMHVPIFVDGRNFLNARKMTNAGFRYVGIGR
jgi:UDPglucose 6-dehydrogenase